MNDPLLVTMRGPNDLDVKSLSNFEAGIAFLTLVNQLSPGITFGQLAAAIDGDDSERMAGWSEIKGAATSVKNGIGNVLKDTVNYIGGKAGDAVRLITDEEVIDGASRIGSAYATNGGSEGVRGLLESLGGGKGEGSNTEKILEMFSALGAAFKGNAPDDGIQTAGFAIPKTALPWMVAGGGALILIGLSRGGKRR